MNAVTDMCSCTFDDSNILNQEFSCRSLENTVVFRAEILYTALPTDHNADDFVVFISDWVQSETPTVVVDGTRLDVEATCPTELESFDSFDCGAKEQPETSVGDYGESSDEIVTLANLAVVIGGVCALAIIVSITVIISIILCTKRKKYTTSFR